MTFHLEEADIYIYIQYITKILLICMYVYIYICENMFSVENTNFLQGMGNTMFYRIKTRGSFHKIHIFSGSPQIFNPVFFPLLDLHPLGMSITKSAKLHQLGSCSSIQGA